MRDLKLITHLFISLFIFLIAILALKFFLDTQADAHRQQTYQNASQELLHTVDGLIRAQKEQTMMAALSLAQNPKLLEAYHTGNFAQLDYQDYLTNLKNHTSLSDPWIQIVDNAGHSLYRSWTEKKGDPLYDKRADLRKILHEQRPLSSVSAGIYDLSFKAMIPVIENDQLLGIFEIITKFDTIAKQTRTLGWEPVFLVDDALKPQIIHPVSQTFIHDFYVANRDASPATLNFIEQRQLFGYAQLSHYFSDERSDRFAVFYDLHDINGQSLANLFFIKPLHEIEDPAYLMELNNTYVYAFLLYLIGLAIYFNGFSHRQAQQNQAYSFHVASEVETKTSELLKQKRFMQTILDGVPESVRVYDVEGKLVLQNEASKKARIQGFYRDYSHPDNRVYLTDTFEKAQHYKSLLTFHERSARPQYFEFNTTPLRSELGEITHMIELSYNVTQHFHTQQQLNKQRQDLDFIHHHDPLTHLPNRRLFMTRIEELLASSVANESHLAILVVDLDRFKKINESFGHPKGDQVLIECANRLLHQANQLDLLARIGGDEFGVILNPMPNEDDIYAAVKNISNALDQPLLIDGHIFHITASIGISLYPDDACDALELIQNADSAVYKSKENGRNHFHFYTKDLQAKAFDQLLLENNLRTAIQDNQLELHYQPQLNAKTGSISGFEALVRWNHPTLGLISPDKFIPFSEETGLIIPMGERILEMAMTTIAEWHIQGLTKVRMAVNISAKQLQNADFVASFYRLLERTQCAPEWLELEVTESAVLENKQTSIGMLNELKALGVLISLDDFGTGYSSLSHLKELPIDKVKIDQTFIQNLNQSDNDLEITRAIIQMTKNLNLEVLAEGIETQNQQDMVVNEGCYLVQGFKYSRPNTRTEIEQFLTAKAATSDQGEQ